jgi:hypothetical protein
MSRSLIIRSLLAAAMLTGVSVGAGAALGARRASRQLAAVGGPAEPSPSNAIASVAAVPPSPTHRPPPARAVGASSFWYAGTETPVRGYAGRLQRYRVAVEVATGQDVEGFADRVLADPRGWTSRGAFRLQRVDGAAPAEFTLFLATAATSQAMCATAGLQTGGFTSCRVVGKVIINVDRWSTAIPDYGAPLADYRSYVINHEVGHQLGFGHEACPGSGQPAPVMQQQTYGLKGCIANGWPYLNGQRYQGPAVR